MFFNRLRRKVWVGFSAPFSIAKEQVQTLGASGEDVRRFQVLLNQSGKRYQVCVPVTGVYDEDTRQAVTKFQRAALLVINADGFVGPETAKRLHIKLIGE